MKILLTAIFKDDSEIEFAARMLKSFMPHVDGLAVAITGLSGKHQKLSKLIKKYKGHVVYTEPIKYPQIYARDKNNKWFFSNFAAARNAVFDLADSLEGYDYYCWADVDDVLNSGQELKEAAKNAKRLKLDTVFFTYWYSVKQDDQGRVVDILIDHLRERLVRPHMFKWISRLHEVLVPKDDNYKPRHSAWDVNPKEDRRCVWIHLPGNERVEANLYRNIDILHLQAKEEEYKDPRTLFYLAKTHIDLLDKDNNSEHLTEAEKYLNNYLELSGWEEERANAWQYLGDVQVKQGKTREAVNSLINGLKEYPGHHLIYLKLSHAYSLLEQHEKADHWLDMALAMPMPKTRTTIGNPFDIKLLSASLKYNQAMRKQNLSEAIDWAKRRQALLGQEDDGLVKTLEEAKLMNDAAGWVFNYAKWLKHNGHADRIGHLLNAVAPDMKNEPFVQTIANEALPPKKWPEKSIVYFAGSMFAEWSPKDALSKGLGGSETAVIELSREWVKLGYQVTVYANVSDEGEYDGVLYKHWSGLNWNDTFDIFIGWRNPGVLDRDIKARKVLLDLHDVASNLDFPLERVAKIDKVFVKSNYHRNQLPSVPDDKVAIISNGLDN
jgi:tetratricopeptide (TPR) repeat protein